MVQWGGGGGGVKSFHRKILFLSFFLSFQTAFKK